EGADQQLRHTFGHQQGLVISHEGDAGHLAAITLPDDAAELEALAGIAAQGSGLLGGQVGFLDRLVGDQLVPEVLAAEGTGSDRKALISSSGTPSGTSRASSSATKAMPATLPR